MKIKLFSNSGVIDKNVVIDGFTMTGYLTLYRNPLVTNEAATRQYVDSFPYILAADNITGAPLPIERVIAGISGDLVSDGGVNVILKNLVTPATYSRVTVNAKGQVVSGVLAQDDNYVQTLPFNQITGRPTLSTGYITDTGPYVVKSPATSPQIITGQLSLVETPVASNELVSLKYLGVKLAEVRRADKVGEMVFKPNTIEHVGYLKANGGSVSKVDYAQLYAIIEDKYTPSATALGYMGQPWRQQYAFNPNDPGDSLVFTAGNALFDAVSNTQVVVTKNRAYLIGGYDGFNNPSNVVYTATIDSNGVLGAWVSTATNTTVTLSASNNSGTVPKKLVTVKVTGKGGTGTTTSVVIDPGQAYIAPTGNSAYPNGLPPYNPGQAYVPATYNNTYTTGGDTTFTINGETKTFAGGYGGDATASDHTFTIPYTDTPTNFTYNIASGGSLSVTYLDHPTAQSSGLYLPAPTVDAQAILTKNRVYLLGGKDSSAVYTATVDVNGTLGAWTSATALPVSISGAQVVVTTTRVYLLGGVVTGVTSPAVYSAPLNVDGTLGAWTAGTPLPAPVSGAQLIFTNKRVHLVGGYDGTGYLSTSFTAPVNSDGTLGTWQIGNSLPAAIASPQALVTGHRVYLFGGNNASADVSTVYTCTIGASGMLNPWTQTTALASTLKNAQSLVTSSSAYLVGGRVGGTLSKQVIKAPFTGGVNDYLALIANPSNTLSPNFNLPDLTAKSLSIYEYYIRALP